MPRFSSLLLVGVALVATLSWGCGGGLGSPPATSGAERELTRLRPPAPPTLPPPAGRSARPREIAAAGAQIELQPGWNMISFPVSGVTALAPGAGVHPVLFAFRAGGYEAVELTPEALNAGQGTARGFWAYASEPTTLAYEGSWDGTTPDTLALEPGWNLVGHPVPFASSPATLQVASSGGPLQRVLDASCSTIPPSAPGCAVHRWAFAFESGAYSSVDLQDANTRISSGGAGWLYSHAAGVLQFPLQPVGGEPVEYLLSASDGVSAWRIDPGTAALRYQGRDASVDPGSTARFAATTRPELLYLVDGGVRPVLVDQQDGSLTFLPAQAGVSSSRAACVDRTGRWLLVGDGTVLKVARIEPDGTLTVMPTSANLPAPAWALGVVSVDGQDVVVAGLQGGFAANQRNVLAFPFDPSETPSLGAPGSGAVVGAWNISVLGLESAAIQGEQWVYALTGTRLQAYRVDASGNLYSRLGLDVFTATNPTCLVRLAAGAEYPTLVVGSKRTDQANLKFVRGDSLQVLKSMQLAGGVNSVASNPLGTLLLVGTGAAFPNRLAVDVRDPAFPITASAVDRGSLPEAIHVVRVTPPSPQPSIPAATRRLNLGEGGVQADAPTYGGAVSNDGRYVVFSSAATNLVPGDSNGVADIFLRDLQSNTVVLLTRGVGGTPANGASMDACFSDDGRYVAFASAASNLVADDTNGFSDIFLHDRQAGSTVRVSLDSSGSQGNGHSTSPSLSGDGTAVGFTSTASNLVAGDTNGQPDVFVRLLGAGSTERVSVSSASNQGTAGSYGASLSGTGRFVAFWSYATEFAGSDTNGTGDVFVHDRLSRMTYLISQASNGTQLPYLCRSPRITSEGRYVLFDASTGANSAVVYLRDRTSNQTSVVSVGQGGVTASGYSYGGGVSADGRYVAFTADAALVPEDRNGVSDVYLLDRTRGNVVRASVGERWQEGNAASFASGVLGDGRVLYASDAPNLVAGDTNGQRDVFLTENRLPLLGE